MVTWPHWGLWWGRTSWRRGHSIAGTRWREKRRDQTAFRSMSHWPPPSSHTQLPNFHYLPRVMTPPIDYNLWMKLEVKSHLWVLMHGIQAFYNMILKDSAYLSCNRDLGWTQEATHSSTGSALLTLALSHGWSHHEDAECCSVSFIVPCLVRPLSTWTRS